MPEFDLSAYGKTIIVPSATLTVVSAGTIASHAPPELFLQLPPGDFYVGQLLRVKLLLPVSPEGNVIGLSQPQIKGEFIFSEPAFMGMSQETVQHDGKVFSAFVQQVMITPLREGAEELIGQAHCYMVRPNPANPNLMQRATTLVDSEPVTLPVKALPASGVLPGFTGAVGSFQMETPVLSAREVKAGEPLTVSVTIRGDGNLGRLTPPPVPRLRDWEGFPPPADTTPSAAIQQRGYVTFNYIFIPQSARLDATPAIPFSYFDPEKKAYVDLSVPAMPVKINPLPAGTANQASPSPENFNPRPEDSAVVAREPNYNGLLPTPGKIAASGKPLQQQIGFMVLQIVPAALLGGLWYRERRRRYWAQHPDLVLKRRARRQLRRQMKCIRRAARARDAAGFIAAATNALREVCAPHSGATPGAMTLADVLRELPASEQAGRAGETVHKLFAASNALRFGGMAGENSELLALQNELEQILDGLKLRL